MAVALIESPPKGLAVLGYVLVYQGIENYLLAPRITARTMELHPAVAFGAAFAGGSLMGVPGALMALPVAATIQALIGVYLQRHEVVESPLTVDAKAAWVEALEATESVATPKLPGRGRARRGGGRRGGEHGALGSWAEALHRARRTRRSMSSRTARTSARGRPAGSATSQSS